MTTGGTRTVAGSPGLGYRPELDGIRGVAILVVLFHHARGWFPGVNAFDGGVAGVELFFVLSGFLITTLLLDEYRTSGRISFGAFYARRALRLLPAMAVALALGALVANLLVAHGKGVGLPYLDPAMRAAAFIGDIRPHGMWFLAHTWSVAVEAQYYFVWPVVLLVLLKTRIRLSWLALIAAAGAVVVAYYRSRLLHTGVITDERSILRVDGILLGSAVALLLATLRPNGPIARIFRNRTVAFIGVWGGVAGIVAISRTGLVHDILVAASLSFAIVVAHVALDRSSPFAAVLRVGPLVEIGRISYGLYLFHYPLFYLSRKTMEGQIGPMIAALALSIGLAMASYHGIERPILGLKHRVSRSRDDALAHGVALSGAPSPRLPESPPARTRPNAAVASP